MPDKTNPAVPFVLAVLTMLGVVAGLKALATEGGSTSVAADMSRVAEAPGALAPTRAAPGTGAGFLDELHEAGRVRAAHRLEQACSGDWAGCPCLRRQVSVALDVGAGEHASRILSASEGCFEGPLDDGLFAEALVRTGRVAEALARGSAPGQGQAASTAYVRAHAAFLSGDLEAALSLARKAQRAGRGVPALLLQVVIHFQRADFGAALRATQAMLETDPNDPDALYNLALAHQRLGHYREAREAYLALLARVPRHADARYNLGILTHSVGALPEARHNLEKLTKILGPDEPRVTRLRAVIAGPPASQGGRFVFGDPGSSTSDSQAGPVRPPFRPPGDAPEATLQAPAGHSEGQVRGP